MRCVRRIAAPVASYCAASASLAVRHHGSANPLPASGGENAHTRKEGLREASTVPPSVEAEGQHRNVMDATTRAQNAAGSRSARRRRQPAAERFSGRWFHEVTTHAIAGANAASNLIASVNTFMMLMAFFACCVALWRLWSSPRVVAEKLKAKASAAAVSARRRADEAQAKYRRATDLALVWARGTQPATEELVNASVAPAVSERIEKLRESTRAVREAAVERAQRAASLLPSRRDGESSSTSSRNNPNDSGNAPE